MPAETRDAGERCNPMIAALSIRYCELSHMKLLAFDLIPSLEMKVVDHNRGALKERDADGRGLDISAPAQGALPHCPGYAQSGSSR